MMKHLCNLTPNGTRHSQGRVHVNKETSRVLLNLRNLEVGTSVRNTISAVQTGLEWSLHAADAVGILLIADWVGKSDSWWA